MSITEEDFRAAIRKITDTPVDEDPRTPIYPHEAESLREKGMGAWVDEHCVIIPFQKLPTK